MQNGRLYTIAYNDTEPEIMYFRSTELFLDTGMKGTAVKRLKAGTVLCAFPCFR